MHCIERSVLVPHGVERMFRLVENVAEYPKFLPWCPAASVRPLADGAVEATIEIAYKGVRSSFTTRNVSSYPDAIDLEFLRGPFKRLSGRWIFQALAPDASKVSLQLQYQFASGLLGRLIAPVFESIAGSMVDAFARRAESPDA
jgi:ribosome-associated toxin RatA of RatAB toxin-antitoxin module